MEAEGELKVTVEFGSNRAEFKGSPKEVFSLFVRFLENIYPNLAIIREISFETDLISILEALKDFLKIAPEGPLLMKAQDLATDDAICLLLAGEYAGFRLHKLSKDSLSSSELAKLSGKANKTVINRLPQLIRKGFVEKSEESEYRITNLGIKRVLEIASKNKEILKAKG
jgi:DNA-binding HxlR family transcriptional regulator